MKKAFVTGASEGIGRSFAVKLAARGFSVTAVARSEPRLRDLTAELGGSAHSYLVADLSSQAGIDRAAAALSKDKFDLLVNNAGSTVYGPFREAPLARIEESVRLNCGSLLALSHAFLRTAARGDALINVSSTASFLPMPIASAYTASKAFVTALSEALWYEERARGVYVLGLCPGMTATRFHERAGGKKGQVPGWLSQSPDQVVETALKALAKRRAPVVVCGPQKYAIWASRAVPRRALTILAGKALDLGLKD